MKKKPHVCVFMSFAYSLKDWEQLGILQRETSFYQELARNGVRVSLVTYGDESDLDYCGQLQGIEIHPLYKKSEKGRSKFWKFFGSFFLASRLKKVIRDADFLKTNQMFGAWLALVCSWVYGKKLLVRCGYELYETMLIEKKARWKQIAAFILCKMAYRRADQIVLTSKHSKKFIEDSFAVSPDKIHVIPNFINTDLFAPDQSSAQHQNRMITIGRLHEQKNYFQLIQAACNCQVGLDIIGDGPLKADLKQFATKLSADVRFMGKVANGDLPKILNQYPIFILASIWEGNPKVLLEAMSCARAIVATDVVGTKDIIRHKINGVLCQCDAKSLSLGIQSMFKDPLLQKNLGQAAREVVIKKCSFHKAVKKELSVYQKMVV